jgi:hypothetical protein
VISALLELNTGLPFALSESELSDVDRDQYLPVLLSRVKSVAPDIDPGTIENILVQYDLHIRSHHAYRLQRYEGTVVLFEPDDAHRGLLPAVFRPYVKDLRYSCLKLGRQSDGTRTLSESFSADIRAHFLSIRDDEFVRQLSEELEPWLQ